MRDSHTLPTPRDAGASDGADDAPRGATVLPPLTSEQGLRTLLEQAPVAIVVIRSGRTTYVNQRCRALFRYAGEGAGIGLSIEDVWEPEFRGRIAELVRMRAAGKPVPATLEGIARRFDGTRFPAHVELETLSMPDGPATLAFVTDTTAQREAQARIEQLNRLHAMVSATNEMILRVDDVALVLQNACDIAVVKGGFRMAWIGVLDPDTRELRPAASAGHTDGYLDAVHINLADPARRAGPSGRAMLTGAHQFSNDIATDRMMAPWRDAALACGYHSSAAFPLRADGQVVGLLSLYSARTGSFDAGELAVLDDLALDIGFAIEIARRTEERRRLETQLLQAQKMEAIGRLAGGIAHDFNNILAAILMQAELGAAGEAAPETRALLEDIAESAQRAAGLTRQLLAFSRRQVMQPKELDLNTTVGELVRMLTRMVGEDVELQVQLHPSPLLARADSGMLDQVLMNLAVNARDAMPQGGRLVLATDAVSISGENQPDGATLPPGRYVRLSVSDSGCGIPPDVLPHIFEPFFTTKEAGKGTGLGLATVFGIVKQHDGAVTVRSAVNSGTTFEVYLPATPVSPAAESPPPATSASPGGNETILLAEDDAAVRRLSRQILERAGYRVLEAADGASAEHLWEQHGDGIQLLITDIVMPGGVGGRELAEKLHARNPALRTLFCTGYSAGIGGQELAFLQGQHLLQKPFDSASLLDAVRRRLDR